MKIVSFKNIAFATLLLLTSTANAYFDTKELSNLSDGELWDKSLHLALKTLSISKDPQKKNLYAYNLFKLSVLSLEEERREFASPIFYSDPEHYITFDVYAHLLLKYSSLVSNTNPDLLDEIANRYSEESLLCFAALNEFVTTIGLQKKSADTFSPKKIKTKEDNSPVLVSTKEEKDLLDKLHVANKLQLQKEEEPSSLETIESDSKNGTVIAPPKEENISESLTDLSSLPKPSLSKLTDVRKARAVNKKKRPPTLRGLKKNIIQEETQPSLTTEAEKPQEETQPSLTTKAEKPQEETQPSLTTELEGPQEEKKIELAPPVENELTEKEKKILRITQGGGQFMMLVPNLNQIQLKKTTSKQAVIKPSNQLTNQTDFRGTLKRTNLASKTTLPLAANKKLTEDIQN